VPGPSSRPYESPASEPWPYDEAYPDDPYELDEQSHSNPGAVGASALPSLSPQTPDVLPAPPADSNHTLVVSDATQVGLYGDLPPAEQVRPYGGRYRGRRVAGDRHDPWLSRLLFSGRLVYLIGGLAVILVIALATWWFSSGRYLKVPSLAGLTVQQAKTVLQNTGLQYRIGKPRRNPIPKDHVIKASPASGQRVASGSTVKLTVSLGPTIFVVPNVSGQPETTARAYLRQHHMQLGPHKLTTSSTVPAGDVIGTIPHAYVKIPYRTKITLVISQGPGLPNFVGMQVTDAETAAAAGGYTINPVANAKGQEPANTIVSQNPDPNTPITPGEVVTVRFSPGPPTAPVPDVTGMPIAQAIQTMHNAGFRITVNHQGPGATVGSYTPTGDQPKGTVITLNVGVFSGL